MCVYISKSSITNGYQNGSELRSGDVAEFAKDVGWEL